jgi:3-oxoadipate enol-lactonase
MLLKLGNRRIHYDLVGPQAGPVVCFCHSLSSDGGSWAEQVPPVIAAGFQALRIDMRGHGGSDKVAGPYTMDQLADDVVAVLDALSLDRVHYVGLSIGGMLGQAFAIKHGARARSLMWCDTLPATAPDAKAAWAPRIEAVTKAGSLEPLGEGTMERWFTDAFKKQNPRRWKEIRDTVVATTPEGFLGCAAAIQDFDFTRQLPAVKLPTLVVCGADDQGTPASENRRLAGLVPGARYEEIADARHFPNVERPEIFNRILMDWLNANR